MADGGTVMPGVPLPRPMMRNASCLDHLPFISTPDPYTPEGSPTTRPTPGVPRPTVVGLPSTSLGLRSAVTFVGFQFSVDVYYSAVGSPNRPRASRPHVSSAAVAHRNLDGA